MSSRNFFSELKRRNVIRATILYLGAVLAPAQGISQLGLPLGAPEWCVVNYASGKHDPPDVWSARLVAARHPALRANRRLARAEAITMM